MKPIRVITIGRSSKNDVVIRDEKASRIHCQILKYEDGSYGIVDFGSTNGTYVNGNKIYGETRLTPYDNVRIGSTTLPWRDYFSKTPQHTYAQATVSDPYAQQPAYQQPQPQYQQPAYQQPYQQPASQQPVYQQLVFQQSSDNSVGSHNEYSRVSHDSGNDTVGLWTFITGLAAMFLTLWVFVSYFVAPSLAIELAGAFGGSFIQCFILHLHGSAFSDGQWLWIILALVLGTASDFISGTSSRSEESSLETIGSTLANIALTVSGIFLLLAIFAEPILKAVS